MPTIYQFDDFQIQINNPTITVASYVDNMDGTCLVNVQLSLGAAPSNTRFIVELSGFTYVGDPTHVDIEAWVLLELVQYEI